MSPSLPHTGSCGVLDEGHVRGQFVEIARFVRPDISAAAAAICGSETESTKKA